MQASYGFYCCMFLFLVLGEHQCRNLLGHNPSPQIAPIMNALSILYNLPAMVCYAWMWTNMLGNCMYRLFSLPAFDRLQNRRPGNEARIKL